MGDSNVNKRGNNHLTPPEDKINKRVSFNSSLQVSHIGAMSNVQETPTSNLTSGALGPLPECLAPLSSTLTTSILKDPTTFSTPKKNKLPPITSPNSRSQPLARAQLDASITELMNLNTTSDSRPDSPSDVTTDVTMELHAAVSPGGDTPGDTFLASQQPLDSTQVKQIIDSCTSNSQFERMEEMMTKLTLSLSRQIFDQGVNIDKTIQSQNTLIRSISAPSQEINTKVSKLEESVSGMQTKIQVLTEENGDLKKRLWQLEKYSRYPNLIISGVDEDVSDLQGWYANVLLDHFIDPSDPEPDQKKKRTLKPAQGMLPSVIPDKIHRIPGGKPPRDNASSPTRSSRPRKVLIKFKTHSDGDFIWARKRGLKDSGLYMEEHIPDSLEKIRRPLHSMATIARKKGFQARVQDDYLYIESKRYYPHELDSLPPELQDIKNHCYVTENQIAFLGYLCPLSNFHKAPFEHDNVMYSSSEQFIQTQKANLFPGNDRLISRMMSEDEPTKLKYLGTLVKNYDNRTWRARAMALVQPGLTSKFEQNPHALDFLSRTGKRKIVEANSSDKLFGIAQGFGSETLLDQSTHHSGENIQGKMLESIREVLCWENQ